MSVNDKNTSFWKRFEILNEQREFLLQKATPSEMVSWSEKAHDIGVEMQINRFSHSAWQATSVFYCIISLYGFSIYAKELQPSPS